MDYQLVGIVFGAIVTSSQRKPAAIDPNTTNQQKKNEPAMHRIDDDDDEQQETEFQLFAIAFGAIVASSNDPIARYTPPDKGT